MRYGQIGVAIMTAPPVGGRYRGACADLLRAYTERSGTCSRAKIVQAVAVLHALGSPTRLGYAKWLLSTVASYRGMGGEKVPLRKIIKWRHKPPIPGLPAYLYVFQTKPPTYIPLTADQFAPGGLIFGVAKTRLLRPLAARLFGVMAWRSSVPRPGLPLVLGSFSGGALWTHLFGKMIPKVILLYPSKAEGWN